MEVMKEVGKMDVKMVWSRKKNRITLKGNYINGKRYGKYLNKFTKYRY